MLVLETSAERIEGSNPSRGNIRLSDRLVYRPREVESRFGLKRLLVARPC